LREVVAMKAPTKSTAKRTLGLALLPLLFVSMAAYMHHRVPPNTAELDKLALLVPDSLTPSSADVHEWQDVAAEEGLHLSILHDSEFLNPMRNLQSVRGIILPDTIHRVCSDALIGALYDYVRAGGRLMALYDGCTFDLKGNFTRTESRLSALVGVSYALYDRYRTESIHTSTVWGTQAAMQSLQVPPGKYLRAIAPEHNPGAGLKAIVLKKEDSLPHAQDGDAAQYVFVRYQYGDLEYPIFRTEGEFQGAVLLRAAAGVAAGVRQEGAGGVLFVNLPLGYLEDRTDGLLLHSFLHYFAGNLLHLPYMSAVPDGIGGLIFNWHVDAGWAIPALDRAEAAGIFDQGPFSIDFTAGPDVDNFGDGKGIDLVHNPDAQRLIRKLLAHGHSIGAHGGWIHNYFGLNLSDNNAGEFSKYIQMNLDAIRQVTGRPAPEYSAPVGNHPQWVSKYLEDRGIHAYYFSGMSGMAPTEVYRDHVRDGQAIWAFPVQHLGKYASLEEMSDDRLPPEIVREWLVGMTDFVAHSQTSRLIYTHPWGFDEMNGPLTALLSHARELRARGVFRWYSMPQMAAFLNARQAVAWQITQSGNRTALLDAHAPEKQPPTDSAGQSLDHQSWVLPDSQFSAPRVLQGKAVLRHENGRWMVTAGDCKSLQVEFKEQL
jgi:hypothetical protein